LAASSWERSARSRAMRSQKPRRRCSLEDEKTRKTIGAADSSDALLALYQNA